MQSSFTYLAGLLTVAAAWSAPITAVAQNSWAPVAVTGYTADVIANGAGTVASSTTTSVDRGNTIVRWCFADSSYVSTTGQRPTRALPSSGLIRSLSTTGLRFQMAPSNQNNSLRIDGSGAATLTLVTPQATTGIKLLACEGNGSNGTDKAVTVAFTDGSNQVITGVRVPDWFGGVITPAIHVASRVNRIVTANYTIENNPTDPTLYEIDMPLAVANAGKLVHSITIAKTLTDPVLNVMGVSFAVSCTAPAPPVITQTSPGHLSSSAATGNQWYYNGLPISGATNQTYVVQGAAQNGSYTVTASSGPGCTSGASAPVVVTLLGTAGSAALAEVQLTPNPAHATCSVRVPAVAGVAAVQLQLLNTLGQPVQTLTLPATGARADLDLRQLAAGLYVLRVQAGTASTTRQLRVE